METEKDTEENLRKLQSQLAQADYQTERQLRQLMREQQCASLRHQIQNRGLKPVA